jgi:beta-hydroxylase
MNPDERAFNQPESLSGKAVFALINWLERRVSVNSKVGSGPFFDEKDFSWLDGFKDGWRGVNAEAETVLKLRQRLPAFHEISKEVGFISKDDQWKTFMLMGYGFKCKKNLAECPTTKRALGKIPGLKTAFFSILEPGKALPSHRGPYNGVLRLHLGLVIPNPAEKCWIRVGTEHRYWQPGEVLIFDDSIDHEVHNNTDGVRVVLFIDFVRPCSWPVSWMNRLLIFAARYSPLVQNARRNHERWEQGFYPTNKTD